MDDFGVCLMIGALIETSFLTMGFPRTFPIGSPLFPVSSVIGSHRRQIFLTVRSAPGHLPGTVLRFVCLIPLTLALFFRRRLCAASLIRSALLWICPRHGYRPL